MGTASNFARFKDNVTSTSRKSSARRTANLARQAEQHHLASFAGHKRGHGSSLKSRDCGIVAFLSIPPAPLWQMTLGAQGGVVPHWAPMPHWKPWWWTRGLRHVGIQRQHPRRYATKAWWAGCCASQSRFSPPCLLVSDLNSKVSRCLGRTNRSAGHSRRKRRRTRTVAGALCAPERAFGRRANCL